MASCILIISRLWQGSVGFRPPRSTTSSFLLLQQRRINVFSQSILNTAACHHHNPHHGDDDRHLTSPRLPFNISPTRRNWHGTGVGRLCSFQFRHINRKTTSGRSFASKSKSNERSQNPPVKANFDAERSGRQQKRERKDLLTVPFILDDYVQRCKKLMPYQVAATWNDLGKSVQKSRKRERQNFWINHNASLQTLVNQTIQSVDQFDGRSTATVTHSLVKLMDLTNSKNLGARESLWNALLHKTILLIQSNGLNAHSLSNLIWAYAKVDGIIKVDGRLLSAIADKAELCVNDFAPQGFSNVAWGFATLNHKAPSLFDAIAIAAQARIDEFNPQALSNMIMAYAKMNHKSPELFAAIARAAQIRIKDFTPQNLSNMAWSFATLHHHVPALFDDIARGAQGGIEYFNPQALSNMMLAYAKLNHESPNLFDAIAQAAQVRIDDFKPQGLTNTAWAFATLNHKAPSLFDAIAKTAQERIDDFKPQEVSNVAWAFATLNHDAPSLFDAIARTAQECIDDFKPQEVSNVAWAYATMNHEVPELFDAIATSAQGRIGDFNPQNLANTAWAFATLNHEAPSLFHGIARAAQVRIDDFNPQNLANTAWAFAVLNVNTNSLLTDPDSPFAQTLLSTEPTSFSIENLFQLHQYHLWCRERNALCWISDELSSHCMDAFVSTKQSPSRLQRDVVASLETLQEVSQVQEEFRTSIGYSLDAVIVYRGNKIGVEVDGPSHFVGRSQSPNGNTVLKHRQLRTLEGWKLVAIPYWEWYEICAASGGPTLESNKQAYLRSMLEGAVVV